MSALLRSESCVFFDGEMEIALALIEGNFFKFFFSKEKKSVSGVVEKISNGYLDSAAISLEILRVNIKPTN